MNMQPKHDADTGDLRGTEQLVAMPGDIDIGNLPNSDTPTDDMRGHEPPPETDAEGNRNKIIAGAVVAVIVIGAVASYATGLWNAAPSAPATRVAASHYVPPAVPAVTPQPAAPVQAAPAADVVEAPVAAHVVKRTAVPSHRPVVQAQPKPVTQPPPLTAAPPQPMETSPVPPAIEPAPPAQILPDQPVPPAPSP